MSLKQEIETWVAALAAYDANEFDSALSCFRQIADTSKILFNLGVIHATLGEHPSAVACYQRAVQLDQYLAVAYFQQGVSNFLMGDFEEALANFNDTLLYLRGNNNIDYEQLGLKFKLFSCEVLFNRGLCYIYLQQKDAGMQDLHFAAREKMVLDHDVIEEAIREQAEGYTVFSIPVGVVYRPNEAKVRNLRSKDYLGKARLVAAQDQQRANFDARRTAALAAMAAQDDRPEGKLSYGALNLVRPDLRSRGATARLQSEPPLNRNVFPPTPPPEPERDRERERERERPGSGPGKRKSEESLRSNGSGLQRAAAKPLRLELGAAAFEQKAQARPQVERPPRYGTKRAESERPAVRREYHPRAHEGRQRASDREIPEVATVQEDPVEASSQQQQQQQPEEAPQPSMMMHQRSRSSAHRSYLTIDEEDEQDSIYDPADPEPLAFEIIPPRPRRRSRHRHSQSQSQSQPQPRSRPAETKMKTLRIKVHAQDLRYVMTTPSATFAEVSELIRAKFGFVRGGFRVKTRDEEGDLVTLSDEEDWGMVVAGVVGGGGAVEMGKMELWVQEGRVEGVV